jgi:LytS/YehU family sensor histidine kinase
MEDLKRFWAKQKGIILLNIVAFLGFFLASKSFTRVFTKADDDEIASALTVCFFFGIYIGRFVAHLGIDKKKNVNTKLLWILPFVIVIAAFWSVVFATKLLNHFEAYFIFFLAIIFLIFSIAVGMFIKLVRTKIHTQLEIAETSAAQSKSELQLLQSQLSPHFLFNTLNNMYGISIAQHEKIPPLLLKLSDLLRYSVYDAKELFVPLKDELTYIENYIDFEKIRIGDRLELTLDIEEVTTENIKIAPMLLIVFIENAFKHSKNSVDEKIFIEIGLKTWGNSILFSVKNSHQNKAKNSIFNSKNGGIGLENVQKRLALIYLNEYDLKMQNNDLDYQVMLRLNAK